MRLLLARARGSASWLAVCLGLFVLLAALVNPLHNLPVGDDWEYARSVQHLLASGEFYRSPLVQATVFAHVLWGALFAQALGFSFVALRLSTLPLAAGALAGFYGVLGQLGFPLGRRVLGVLALMVTPLFVFYSQSFNTEVPFLCWLLLGLWCSLRALRTDRLRWMWAGSVFSALAFLTRQIGLALPAAAALVVMADAFLAERPRRRGPLWLAASVALPLLAVVGFYGWQALAGQTSWADSAITGQGTLGFMLSAQFVPAAARRVVLMGVTLALYMLPLWLAFLPGWRRAARALLGGRRWLQLGGLVLAAAVAGSVAYFGLRGEWWPYYQESLTRAGLGPSLAFFAFPRDLRPPFLPLPFWVGMSLVGALLAALLAAGLVRGVGRLLVAPGRPLARLRAASLLCAAWQALGPGRALVAAMSMLLLAAVLVFPIVYARYFLPLLPGAIILFLSAVRRLRPSPALAGGSLLVMGLLSVALMWDSWNWHEVRWARSQALVARGVPLEKLDAGYEWSGWHLSDEAYAFLQAAHRPLITDPWQAVIDPQYMVTFSLVPGYHVVEVWPFYSPFRPGGADQLLLLERGAS